MNQISIHQYKKQHEFAKYQPLQVQILLKSQPHTTL